MTTQFLKVNLYNLFHHYEQSERYFGSGRNISLEKVNIHISTTNLL